ncbi:hypothetical protein ACJIZ3_011394 [Penstemon smallii]|uniref:Ubiquitin receptor RAD23 n=1 Tax=Penstemon smallii TaxID=265156 RepID=A0ABD3UJ63_9LAMI
MKLTVETLEGSQFQINVHQNDTIMTIKKNIEDILGKDNYPCGQQFLIHKGKVLKDESTLAQNKVSEDGFLVVMRSKGKALCSSGSTSSQPAPIAAPATNPTTLRASDLTTTPEALAPLPAPKSTGSTYVAQTASDPSNPYAKATSNLVGGNNLYQVIQQLIEVGGGRWDRETVIRALRAAYNNPERAVDYLYSGIPESTEVAVPLVQPAVNLASGRVDAVPASFPQEAVSGAVGGGLGSLNFLRNNGKFQALRTTVQSNQQILQPMLQELRKQNPSLMRLIQENHQEFLRLINEPVDSSEEDTSVEAQEDMPHDVSFTPAEQEAIERMEAMGFARAFVIEAFLACDRNEEFAVNYLLENARDFED